MSGHFKYIVAGRGMMGAAAARHLAENTEGVALIGPGEPADIKSHPGVFASHYDDGALPAPLMVMRTGRYSPTARSRATPTSRQGAAWNFTLPSAA